MLDNGKPNAMLLMTRIAESLAARTGAQVSVALKKGPRGESANAAIPCAPDIFERIVAQSDIVITGTADCGSCTAYSVYDGIELEKAGRVAVVVTTTHFRPIAETMPSTSGSRSFARWCSRTRSAAPTPTRSTGGPTTAVDDVIALCTQAIAA